MENPPVSADAAIEELDNILERETSAPFARALNARCYGGSAPYWRELADRLRRAAELTEWLTSRGV